MDSTPMLHECDSDAAIFIDVVKLTVRCPTTCHNYIPNLLFFNKLIEVSIEEAYQDLVFHFSYRVFSFSMDPLSHFKVIVIMEAYFLYYTIHSTICYTLPYFGNI